jgi:hypothetical protein
LYLRLTLAVAQISETEPLLQEQQEPESIEAKIPISVLLYDWLWHSWYQVSITIFVLARILILIFSSDLDRLLVGHFSVPLFPIFSTTVGFALYGILAAGAWMIFVREDPFNKGPKILTKLLFLLGTLMLLPVILEPSVFVRFAHYMGVPIKDSCIVPPWWWITKASDIDDVIPHGWASWMDIFMWMCMLGYTFIFSAVQIEYRRNKDVWTNNIGMAVANC